MEVAGATCVVTFCGENDCMEPTPELIDEIYRDKVLRARQMKPEDKLAAGGKLFALAAEMTKAGIRHQFPGISEERVREILTERLALRKRLEEIE